MQWQTYPTVLQAVVHEGNSDASNSKSTENGSNLFCNGITWNMM